MDRPLSRPSATLSPPCGERAGRGVPIWSMVPMHAKKRKGALQEPTPSPLSSPPMGERIPRNENSRVETPEPRENIEHPTSNTERRSERGFALPFDVRRWMFDVGCSSGLMERVAGGRRRRCSMASIRVQILFFDAEQPKERRFKLHDGRRQRAVHQVSRAALSFESLGRHRLLPDQLRLQQLIL